MPPTDEPSTSAGSPDPAGAAAYPVAPPLAPPTVPGQLIGARLEPTWPGVLGIMCLVYGILISLVAVASLLAPIGMAAIASVLPPEDAAAMGMATSRRIVLLNVVYYLPALIVNAWLSLLGYRLYQKRAAAASGLRIWALVKIGVEILGAMITMIVTIESMEVQQEIMAKELAKAGGNTPPPAFLMSGWFLYGPAAFATLWGLFIGCALPIFLLIWFQRRSVRDYIATWPAAPLLRPATPA